MGRCITRLSIRESSSPSLSILTGPGWAGASKQIGWAESIRDAFNPHRPGMGRCIRMAALSRTARWTFNPHRPGMGRCIPIACCASSLLFSFNPHRPGMGRCIKGAAVFGLEDLGFQSSPARDGPVHRSSTFQRGHSTIFQSSPARDGPVHRERAAFGRPKAGLSILTGPGWAGASRQR